MNIKVSYLKSCLEKDFWENKVDFFLGEVIKNLIVVFWASNDLFLIQNNEIKFYEKCSTGKNWFWNEIKSKKTPLWLHKITGYYGDWLPWNAILKGRVDTWKRLEYFPSYPNIYPVILSRILQLSGLEARNSNTFKRYIYIHWTPNIWYWDKKEFNQSYWCLWLKPEKMIELFDMVKLKDTFVYIMNKKLWEK